MLLELLSIRS